MLGRLFFANFYYIPLPIIFKQITHGCLLSHFVRLENLYTLNRDRQSSASLLCNLTDTPTTRANFIVDKTIVKTAIYRPLDFLHNHQ